MHDDDSRRETHTRDDSHGERALVGVRIAVDARSLAHPGMGIHSYITAGIRALIDEGADVTLLANFRDEGFTNRYPGVHWESFGSRRDIFWDQISVPRHLRGRSFDYYWAPGNNGIPWRSLSPTRTVSTTHDVIPLRMPRMYLMPEPRFAFFYFVWTLSSILRSDVLITVSESSARDIRAMFHRTPEVISSALSLHEYDGHASARPSGFDFKYLMYSGGMDPRKNVSNLLRGFSLSLERFPELRLVIIGSRTEIIQPMIDELDLRDRVILTGLVSDDEKFALLRSSLALAYPSLYEGFGLPLLEAFAADVPVLTSRNSSLVEVAADAAVYVDPLSPASIADGIAQLFDESATAMQRQHGRTRLKVYDPTLTKRQLIQVFATPSSPHMSRRKWRQLFRARRSVPSNVH